MDISAGRAIVVIDDSPDDIELFRFQLKRGGVTHPLILLNDSVDAVTFFGRAASSDGGVEVPLVCFLDIHMPRRDGFEVLAAIRAGDLLDRMPVIMLSTSDDENDVARAGMLGAQCYLAKHPTPEVLRAVIEGATSFFDRSDADLPFQFPSNLLRNVRPPAQHIRSSKRDPGPRGDR
jgi:two-component system response regulator